MASMNIINNLKSLAIIGISLLIACQDNKTKSLDLPRFSKKFDTTYKENTTEIADVLRTFYQFGSDTSQQKIILAKAINSDEILMVFKDKEHVNAMEFKDSELRNLIDKLRIVLNNPNKKLNYTFGDDFNEGKILLRKEGGGTLFVFNSGVSTFNDIELSEIDSIENCYNRFLSEKIRP